MQTLFDEERRQELQGLSEGWKQQYADRMASDREIRAAAYAGASKALRSIASKVATGMGVPALVQKYEPELSKAIRPVLKKIAAKAHKGE